MERLRPLMPLATGLAICLCSAARADLVWFDGSVDPTDEPPGLLLSDNPGYYGPQARTGVEYAYETPPDNPGDTYRDTERFGRRLLDGLTAGNWWTPAGVSGGPLIVAFDFQRLCAFSEVGVNSRNGAVAIHAQVGDAPEGPWETVAQQRQEDAHDRQLHRLLITPAAQGRYLRLTVEAPGVSWVDEVLVWGDVVAVDEPPPSPPPGVAAQSITGIDKTAFPDAAFWQWRDSLPPAADQRAVWSPLPTWDSLTSAPILPDANARPDELELVMARNETEQACLALTNVSWDTPAETEVRVVPPDGAEGLSGKLLVGGAMPSRYYGTGIVPLFEADNLLPLELMERYLTNGQEICTFPKLTLPPAGSAVLWLTVTTDMAEPGEYRGEVVADGAPPLAWRVRVVDVVLPDVRVWLQTYSGTTSMFPFVWSDRLEREVALKVSRGVSVWHGFPAEGSPGALARSLGPTQFHVWGSGGYGHRLYVGNLDPDSLTEDDGAAIAEIIHGLVGQAQELGLTYDDWYVELTDEPGRGNAEAFGALARLIRAADPRVRIYCNPCFWEGDGCAPDDVVFEALSPWYNELIDVSAPLQVLLSDRPQCDTLFGAERSVRGFYNVCTQSAKSERAAEVELYRRQAWEAFSRGWDGWGFYSYFAPRGDPWDDSDADWATGEDLPDYQIVYPGPRGPVITRQAEALREGWEDYRLLTLLRQGGEDDLVEGYVQAFRDGDDVEGIRLRALSAAAR